MGAIYTGGGATAGLWRDGAIRVNATLTRQVLLLVQQWEREQEVLECDLVLARKPHHHLNEHSQRLEGNYGLKM